jgi:hypothetical protein
MVSRAWVGLLTGVALGCNSSRSAITSAPVAAAACPAALQQPLVVDCGYTPLAGDAVRAVEASGGWPSATVRLFYNDAHALILGVRRVAVIAGISTVTTDYPVTPLAASPGSAAEPHTGTHDLSGLQSGLDAAGRPVWPVMYVTDVTADSRDRWGDWQQGGGPSGPDAIFGSWTSAVRSVDTVLTPHRVAITPDPDPAPNGWSLGSGDPVPPGLANEGYGAEVRWTVRSAPGHTYRFQFIVHDGAQDAPTETCALFCAGGSATRRADGGTPPAAACQMGLIACGRGGYRSSPCPTDQICANGCCLPLNPQPPPEPPQ